MILFFNFNPALAKKEKTGKSISIEAINNEGEKVVYGSILNPRHDEVNILLQSLIFAIKKGDLTRIPIILVSLQDATKTYVVPKDAIAIRKKKINNKSQKYLVVNLFNLKTQDGVTISPSSLPKGDYKLRLNSKKSTLTTETFNYQTPALVVGVIGSQTTGLISVEDSKGNVISDRSVVSSPNGTFFTEVRANKISKTAQRSNYLKAQTDTEIKDIIPGIIHAVTDKDLFAVVPLDNNAETNALKLANPIKLSETSTFTAQISKSDEDILFDLAKETLSELESGQTFQALNLVDIGCPIDQFFIRCPEDLGNADNFELLESIGTDFKNFLKTATCNFPEFPVLKELATSAPDFANVFIGTDYCRISKNIIENFNRPCNSYSLIKNQFDAELISEIPCPPESCTEFSDIKPPKCLPPIKFCDEINDMNDLCIHR